MACNSDKCHCPACTKERDWKAMEAQLVGLDERLGVLELRESNRDMMRALDHVAHYNRMDIINSKYRAKSMARQRDKAEFERLYPFARYVPNARVIPKCRHSGSPIWQGYGRYANKFWRWDEIEPGHWRKFDIAYADHFGMVYRNVDGRNPDGVLVDCPRAVTYELEASVGDLKTTKRVIYEGNPTAPDSWVREHFEPQGGRAGAFHDVKLKPGVFAAGTAAAPDLYGCGPRKWTLKQSFEESVPIRRDKTGKVEYAMTPFMIEVMLHAYCSCDLFYRHATPAYHAAIPKLIALGLIERVGEASRITNPGWVIKATEKGRVYVEALKATPLPVAAEPEWKMPS